MLTAGRNAGHWLKQSVTRVTVGKTASTSNLSTSAVKRSTIGFQPRRCDRADRMSLGTLHREARGGPLAAVARHTHSIAAAPGIALGGATPTSTQRDALRRRLERLDYSVQVLPHSACGPSQMDSSRRQVGRWEPWRARRPCPARTACNDRAVQDSGYWVRSLQALPHRSA